MKTVLASFFLLVFSFQILPVKEIGKVLFKGAMTEEVSEAEYGVEDDAPPGSELNKEDDPFMPHKHFSNYSKWVLIAGTDLSIRSTEKLSKQFIPDILTPPPNAC